MEEDPAEVVESVEGAALDGLEAAVGEVEAGQRGQAEEGAGGHERPDRRVGAQRERHQAGGVPVQGRRGDLSERDKIQGRAKDRELS